MCCGGIIYIPNRSVDNDISAYLQEEWQKSGIGRKGVATLV